MHCGKKHSRFGHLVSKRQQFIRHSEAERFGGLEVDDKLELDRLLDRKLAGLGSHMMRRAAQQLGEINSQDIRCRGRRRTGND